MAPRKPCGQSMRVQQARCRTRSSGRTLHAIRSSWLNSSTRVCELAVGPVSARVDIRAASVEPALGARNVRSNSVGGENLLLARSRPMPARMRRRLRSLGFVGHLAASALLTYANYAGREHHRNVTRLPLATTALCNRPTMRPPAAQQQEVAGDAPWTTPVRRISRRRHQPALQLGPRAAGARHHGGSISRNRSTTAASPLPAARASSMALEKSELGALLVFDVNNIRYITSTKIGEWERDKLSPLGAALARPASRSCGISAPPPSTTSSTRRGLRRRTARAGLVGLRGTVQSGVRADGAARRGDRLDSARRPASPTCRSASTSSNLHFNLTKRCQILI